MVRKIIADEIPGHSEEAGMTETTPRGKRQDFIIIACTLILIAFGTVMIYSSSYIIATQKFATATIS